MAGKFFAKTKTGQDEGVAGMTRLQLDMSQRPVNALSSPDHFCSTVGAGKQLRFFALDVPEIVTCSG
jgi:hypothetical protein